MVSFGACGYMHMARLIEGGDLSWDTSVFLGGRVYLLTETEGGVIGLDLGEYNLSSAN